LTFASSNDPSYLFHPLKQTDISFRDAMFIY